MRRRWYAAGAALLVAAVGAGWSIARDRDGSAPTADRPNLPVAAVVRGDLTVTAPVDGSLGFADSYDLIGYRPGVVTALPQAGDVRTRGQQVYAVDQRPIPLFYGNLPLYRPLSVGATGADVHELEANLVALGYDDYLTVDDDYTDATAWAVRQWQHALDVPETGAVAAGDAVVAPAAIRVTATRSTVGRASGAGQDVLTATSTVRNVHLDLSTDYQAYVRTGQHVAVELPSGRSLVGVVSRVGAVATAAQPRSGGDSGGTETIPVDIRLTGDVASLGGLDEAPVTVQIVSQQAHDVLSVPVEALHVASGGGYVVYAVGADGTAHPVPVTTGLFATDRVQVSGAGITAGTKVQVPRL